MKCFLIIGTIISSLNFTACRKIDSSPSKPNIILIYADDLGRGLLGTYGQKIIKTPNIDKLANQGIRFENAYGCHYCAPARASLLTGKHDVRPNQWKITKGGIYKNLGNGMTFQQIKDSIQKTAMPAKPNEVFLGQVAKQAGYTTAEFGKLEWGFATTPKRMERHGWDYHFGYYDHQRCHGFYPPFLFENGQKIDIPGNTHADCAKTNDVESLEGYQKRWDMTGKTFYSEDLIMDKLLGYIDHYHTSKIEKPFFLYFPTQLPHGPIAIPEVHPDFKHDDRLTEFEKEYASMVKMLDTDVGRIVSKLDSLQLLENTIIVFTSDNGHEVYTQQKDRTSKNIDLTTQKKYDNVKSRFLSELGNDVFDGNDGMSGLKRSNWEGGVRVPLFWYWKGKIPEGTVSEQRVSNYDFLNTLAEITGQQEIEGKDGISYAKTLFGGQAKERPYTVFNSKIGPALVTNDGWKIRYFVKKNIFELYFLPEDYKEIKNLINQYPERAAILKKQLLAEYKGEK
ncbi:sulfatase-like hydrolase/transferase [Wenyingzhuangia aestuarii]|uniref:sulfatase-like hydrolase/transferase n=1 Tax=Wenyingzhuangia aestuarii TaxID=1647582 RepID=UPI00143A24DB|nr:sulfatase-like hydrolase/transferase [Wenyingzhuangia aestuarii]NJB83679.1 arylsulfatase A-like enzyme [Wenyingzhuangia aestuarii]